ncbi:hypothetical protein LZ30DRAFT_586632 [Colletotrichum cereale]|nr:hypothetical protein LZ30DRAFT_586632 [Colletotrichum cereale]
MPSGSRHSSKQPKKPKEPAKEKWYIVKDILQERKCGTSIEYLVDWEDDPDTGERYRPTWTPSKDVTSKAIFDWRNKRDAVYRGDHATHVESSEAQIIGGLQREGASTHASAADSLDSSQPVQPPRRRKRNQSEQLEDLEDELNQSKRRRHHSEAPSSLSSGSEVDTDAASDVLYNHSSFFVAIPSKVEHNFSEYISVSDSQGSTSLSSQPVSALEDEDGQIVLTNNLSQKTIPDSQDYSAFDTQDSLASSKQLTSSTGNKEGTVTDREIPDSQKQSSLSKSTASQAPLLSASDRSPFFIRQTPLQSSPSVSSRNYQQEPSSLGYSHSTQNSPEQTRLLIRGDILPTLPEPRQTTEGPESSQTAQSPSQGVSQYVTRALHQRLTRERDSFPASISDKSIPSHQVDDLTTASQAEHSANRSFGGDCHQESQPARTPIFLTQPAFDFDIPCSQASSSPRSAAAGSSTALSASKKETAAEQIIACSDTQDSHSQNTQLAQLVAPLPNISASQIGSSSNKAEEPVVPDTVRRKPSRNLYFNTGPTSSDSSDPEFSNVRNSSQLTNESPTAHRLDEDVASEADSFQTCFEGRSLPPPISPYNSQDQGHCGQFTELSRIMDAPSGEPLSAIEELMRIQEAALQGTLTEHGLTSPTTATAHHREVGLSVTDAVDHAFSASLADPSMHINSQPPIGSDWHMGEPITSSTEMPVLSSAPPGPVIEAPVDDAPRTASMGDIFPSTLMPPEATSQLPITISPSDITRSIDPDEALSGLPQHDENPLEMLPEDDTTAGGKSTATSPDVEEPYLSGPPTAVDQSEYLVTVSFPANIRPLYLSTLTAYKREIEKFNLALQSDEGSPDQATVDSIGRLFNQLRDICDMPAPLDGPSIDALSAIDLKKHAMGTNSKFFFVGRFLERLQTSHKKVLIIVRDTNIIGYFEAVVGTGDMAYSLKGLHELESQDEHSLLIVLVHTEQPLVDDLSDFDVVIGFDSGIMQTDVLSQWAEMSGKKPMLIRLMTTCSIEHLELMMPAELEGLERQNALLIALFQARAFIANDEQGEMIDQFTSLFASQAIDPDPGFGWEPEPIPSSVLDFYSSTQPQTTQMPPTAEELTTRKRKADVGSQQVTKRLRVSDSPGRAAGDIDAAVHSHLNPDPSRVHVETTQGHLDSLTTKVSELEYQLEEKTTLEVNLRKHVTNLSKRVKSHDKTINLIQERHMAALRERSQYEAQRDEAQQKESKAQEESQHWQSKAKTLEEELKKKNATLEEALVDAGSVATETFRERTEELEKALAKIAELEKKLESRDGELGYTRDAYQTANHANSELSRENRDLKEQVDLLQKSAVGSLAQVQNVNAGEQVKEMQRQIAETQAISKDREKELTRIEKELRALKNGRRETRQQSVPRSPRLGMMSPRTGRAAGGSASRGTSPTPHESASGTPVSGLQLFNTPANGRWGHLRD